jgi:hypothetical protein
MFHGTLPRKAGTRSRRALARPPSWRTGHGTRSARRFRAASRSCCRPPGPRTADPKPAPAESDQATVAAWHRTDAFHRVPPVLDGLVLAPSHASSWSGRGGRTTASRSTSATRQPPLARRGSYDNLLARRAASCLPISRSCSSDVSCSFHSSVLRSSRNCASSNASLKVACRSMSRAA